MHLENGLLKEFDAVIRARGEETFRSGLVRLQLIGEHAAEFYVTTSEIPSTAKTMATTSTPSATSSSDLNAKVCFDWSTMTDGILKSHCSCETFQTRNEYCQHIWASLLSFDESTQAQISKARSVATQVMSSRNRLTLHKLINEECAAVLHEALDLEAATAWPVIPMTPTAVARVYVEITGKSPERGSKSHGNESDTVPYPPANDRGYQIQWLFKYDEVEIHPKTSERVMLDRQKSRHIKRNLKVEKAYLDVFKGKGPFKKLEETVYSASETHAWILDLLTRNWHVEFEGKPIVPYTKTEGVLGEFNGNFGFAAAFDFNGTRISLKAFSDLSWQNALFAPLGPSRLGLMPLDWQKKIELLRRSGSFSPEGYLLIPRSSMPLLKTVFHETPGIVLDDSVQKIFSGLSSLSETGLAEKPQGLRADLRSYQAEGLFWLEKVASSGFGGILADDMGLGKTIQVISYLLRRARPGSSSLVVLPKSLVFNWLAEVERFAPKLKILDFATAKRGLLRAQDYDVIVTTYHVMKNELDRLEKIEFDTIILDEAQAIKNSTSQVAQAVFKLKGRNRFALSGTPIENSLSDLFSLMHFTNPGLIPRALAKSIGDCRPSEVPRDLTEKVAVAVKPFILRRTKKQVLKELPDKTEQVLFCEMEGQQKKIYDLLRRNYRASLKKEFDQKTKVFEAILRLRQVSSHAGLVEKGLASGSSSKFDLLLEHLDEIRSSGNKALVFSQFTSLLELLKPHLKQHGIRFEYLDGQTHNRGAVVERFNANSETTVFLISLKAGGTGLNLTSASYVFLLDPWWNPAIEAQAIDRAYRMGQKQKVMAYRMIAKGTIEEKILKLQAQKRTLAESVINEDSAFLKSLSVEDLMSLFD